MSIGTSMSFSLLNNQGEVQKKSGLNWGCADANVTENDAYIAFRTSHIKSDPNFFNPRSTDNSISVTWDDGTKMLCSIEGKQNKLFYGKLYGKQITSSSTRKEIGTYLRTRINVFGRRIIREDLEIYGRTYIEITKTGPNEYFFDFSV